MSAKKKILVHVCCASCSSYVLPYLSDRFEVTAYFFNPNIQPEDEYRLRLAEMQRLCLHFDIPFMEGRYEPESWWKRIEPYRNLPERSERCWQCYRQRLEETAKTAARIGVSLFTSTLSVSPHKVQKRIAELGAEAARRHGLEFLGEDFKKKDGFKISVERSRELGLTRQDYCGCTISLEESKRRRSGSQPEPPSG
jgi:predicted adenine nucleotide alpha hydrolase (AANH) superfamily ATPase